MKHVIDRWAPTQMASCASDCNQGRSTCKTPELCQPPAAHGCYEDDDDRAVPGAGPIVWLVIGVACVLAALFLVHVLARHA